MRNVDVVIHLLQSIPHLIEKGHIPSWYDLGAGERYCVNCAKGGGRALNIFAMTTSPKPLH